MTANYHTHTRWCRHGTGEIEDYIREALKRGFAELAITEHVPLPGDPDPLRMLCSEFDDFDREFDSLIKKYSGRITLRKGLECEYYPSLLDYYRDLREKRAYEILILGQHTSIDRRFDNFFLHRPEEVLLYADEVTQGLATGLFTFLAHPDVPIAGYGKADDAFMEAMGKIFSACEKLGIPVEINANGFHYKRGYPCVKVWKLAANYRLDCLVNADAHHVKDLAGPGVEQCETLAKDLKLTVLSRLPSLVPGP
ncbi:MAG: histidinol-phosphatase [Spirochaetaceae bacterium]|jgi:HisJ family histidinol phosphate phosphatase|nr:histidinol-phosphatase [Spirochaetaceae bacterium]